MNSLQTLPTETPQRERSSRLVDLLFLGLVIYLGTRIVDLAATRGFENDFSHYYVSSQAYLAGQSDIYRVDLGPEYTRLQWKEMEEPVYRATNPPALLIFFCLFAFFPPTVAFVLWVTLQIGCLVAIYCLSRKLLGGRIEDEQYKLVISAFLVLPIVEAHFHYSQVQLLLVVLLLLAFDRQRQGQSVQACGLATAAALLKLFPLVLLPWFVWRGGTTPGSRIRLAGWTGLFLVGGILLTGPGLWLEFMQHASDGISVWAKSFPSYSISSFFAKFGIVFSGSNGSDLTNFLFSTGLLVSLSLLILFYVALVKRGPQPELEFSVLLTLMLLCGTTCWLHYLVLVFFPICMAVSRLIEQPSPLKWALIGGMFLMLHTSLFVGAAAGPAKLVVTNLPFLALCVLLVLLAREWLAKGPPEKRPAFSA